MEDADLGDTSLRIMHDVAPDDLSGGTKEHIKEPGLITGLTTLQLWSYAAGIMLG